MAVNCMYVLGGRLGDSSLLPHTGKSRIEGKARLAVKSTGLKVLNKVKYILKYRHSS